MSLDCLTLGPSDPTGVIIWLHGLGADGHDFESVVPILERPDLRVILPHAPVRPVTINGGMPCRSWYDIRHFAPGPGRESAPDIRESAGAVRALIQAEVDAGMPANRIALVGFSQGGAIALHTALRWPERLAAVVALSTYLVLEDTLPTEQAPASNGLPAFFGHGSLDEVVALKRGGHAADVLEGSLDVRWHTYPMGHAVCIDELLDLRDFFREVLPPQAASQD